VQLHIKTTKTTLREHVGKGVMRLGDIELSHKQLWHVYQRRPGDYEPYGKRDRLIAGQIGGDRSGGCKWYHTLSGPASLDWGGCGKPPAIQCRRNVLSSSETKGDGVEAGD
jgi:hypothetical protein